MPDQQSMDLDSNTLSARYLQNADPDERHRLAEQAELSFQEMERWRLQALRAFPGRRTGSDAPITGNTDVTDAPNAPPMRLHHVGIVVREEERMHRFAKILGLRQTRRDHLEEYRVTNVFFQGAGGAEIQFMLPSAGMLANFNRGRGGLHHIALSTRKLTETLEWLADRGVRFIHPDPRTGIDHFRFNFIHPNLEGINVELIEDPDIDWSDQS